MRLRQQAGRGKGVGPDSSIRLLGPIDLIPNNRRREFMMPAYIAPIGLLHQAKFDAPPGASNAPGRSFQIKRYAFAYS
jgi:hypothetical protein